MQTNSTWRRVSSKVLSDPHWVVVPSRKMGLQISLDVIIHSKPDTQVHHPEGVILPVNALAVLAEVVGLTHLEEVYEPVRGLYDPQAGLHVKGGLQRNPGEYALLVKRLQCCQTVIGRSGIAFPFAGKRFIKAGHRRRETITVMPVQDNVSQRPSTTFGQH